MHLFQKVCTPTLGATTDDCRCYFHCCSLIAAPLLLLLLRRRPCPPAEAQNDALFTCLAGQELPTALSRHSAPG